MSAGTPAHEAQAASLRLHGYPVSNYFNAVHAALLEKHVPFEVVLCRASQDEEFLARSPMGKIPVLETSHGWLAETVAILEYLEDVHPEPRLYPTDAFARARARQVINVVQMYVETPARSLYPGVFMGGVNAPATVTAAQATLDRAAAALGRLVKPSPFLLGKALTCADLFTFYALELSDRVTRWAYGYSIVARVAGLDEWRRMISERTSTQTVQAGFHGVFATYLADKSAAYREDRT